VQLLLVLVLLLHCLCVLAVHQALPRALLLTALPITGGGPAAALC
jgi:hypothetical protein